MKPRTIARLDMLAAEREQQLQDALRRHGNALSQAAAQREMLAGYQARLAASWQNGEVVSAAQARRATHFCAGAQTAALQLTQSQSQAEAQLEATATALVGLKSHRRKLADKLRGAARDAETQAARQAERNTQWRRS